MKNLILKQVGLSPLGFIMEAKKEHWVFGLLLLIWLAIPRVLQDPEQTAAYIEKSTVPLVMLSLISFMVVLGLCWWLLQRFWMSLGLPAIGEMVSQFKDLHLWQQLGFFLCSFALVLLAAIGALIAVL